MLKKICFLVDWNMYDVIRHFTKKLSEALEKEGIKTQIIDANEEALDPFAFHSFFRDPPDITCSFNRIDKLKSGKWLWDFLKIPHVAFLVDSPIYYLDLINSPYVILTSVDRHETNAIRSLFKRMLFFPHAIESNNDNVSNERPLDVVFFGSSFDYIGLYKEWKKVLPKELSRVLEMAIDIALINSLTPLSEALSLAWEAAGLERQFGENNFLLLYHYLETFMIGKDRFELINAIQDADVHIYGEPFPIKGQISPEWKDCFPNKKNIIFHRPIKYTETFEILKISKICLNSSPSFRDGTHERIFSGLAHGALPLTSESLYLSESLKDKTDILYYKTNHWHEVNEWINELINDHAKREEMAANGNEKVMRFHTWNVRARELLLALPPILREIGKQNAIS